MGTLAIVLRDVRRMQRNPLRFASLLAIPLLMASLFALAFPGSGALKIKVLVHDEDEGLVSFLLQGAANNPQADEFLELVPVGEEGYALMDEGEASALVHIPEGFTEAVLEGEQTSLTLVKNPAQSFMPQIVEEGLAVGVTILDQAAIVLGDELKQVVDLSEDDSFPSNAAIASVAVGVNEALQGADLYLFPPVLRLESVQEEESGESVAAATVDPSLQTLQFFLPGISILGLLFFAQAATRDILAEREAGLVRHLLTGPVTVRDYLSAKALSALLLSIVGLGTIVALGAAIGLTWGDPLAAFLLVVASSMGASGVLLLVVAMARTERQADVVGTVVVLVGSMVGGSLFPVSQMPDFLLPVSRFTVNYWAASGFDTLIRGGGGIADILPSLAILGGGGFALLVFASWRLRRRIALGGA